MNGLFENWGILWPLPTISMLVVMRARSIKEQKNGASFAWQREDYDSCAATTCKSMQEGSQASIGYHLWFWHLFLHKLVGKPSQLVNFFHDSIQVDPGFMLLRFSQCSYATNRSHWMEHPWAMSWSTPASKSLEAMGIQAELLQHHHEQQEELTANMHLQVNEWGSHVRKSVIQGQLTSQHGKLSSNLQVVHQCKRP